MKRTLKLSRRRVFLIIFSLSCALTLSAARKKSSRTEWQQPDRCIQDMNIKPGCTFADVGCGKGFFTFRIAEAVGNGGKVVALDIDEKSLEKLKQTAARRNITNIKVIKSDPYDTKLAPESVDKALICLVLHHCEEKFRQLLMNSIAKALKPGGFLYVMDFRKVRNPLFHTYEELVARETAIALAEGAGLELDAEWFYLKYQYFLRFRKPLK